jgi:uncharacterized protein YbaP (TraB family)
MMKGKYSCLLVALLSCPRFAPLAPCQTQTAATPASTNHSLWKIEGAKSTVYLLGSVHMLKQSDYPMPAKIESAFSNARIAMFEADIGKMSDPSLQASMLAKSQLPEGETLKDRLSADTYKKFTEAAADAGLPAVMCDRLKPSMAALILTVVQIQKLGFDPEAGLDKHYFELATKQGKVTAGLETPEFQVDLLTGMSKEEDELVMKITIEEFEKSKKEFAELVTAWRTGDSDKLEKLLNEATEQAPDIFKRLVTDRNERWMPKIEELARGDKPAIVIVGAGHLVGKNGVVALLKKKGLKVIQQ